MGLDIKNHELENIENNIKEKIILKMKERGSYESYKKINIVKVKEGIYAISSETGNINFYADDNGEVIFSVGGLKRSLNFKLYTSILGLEEIKTPDGEYIMYKQENGEKRELDKYSVEYFEVWRDIAFTHSRDTILKTIEGTGRSVTHKIPDKALDIFIQEDKAIRLVELMLLGQKGNITKEQFHNHFRELQTQLLYQIGDSRFGLLPNNRQYNINREEKTYTIQTGKVTLDEVNYLKDVGIISDDVYKLSIKKIKDLESIREETKQELSEMEK